MMFGDEARQRMDHRQSVIACGDAAASVAADVVGAKLPGFNVQAVRHRWEAEKLGLGETDTEKSFSSFETLFETGVLFE